MSDAGGVRPLTATQHQKVNDRSHLCGVGSRVCHASATCNFFDGRALLEKGIKWR
jgi:hypothetical protein